MLSMLMTTEYAPPEDRHELQQLLICIAGGEREALAELYQRTRAAVYGLALSYLKNAQDAQDLTQDVYVQVWDCAAQYRSTGSPMGWLLTVCRNLCLMRLRREERHAALSEEEWNAIPAQECGLDADERALLQGALASLTDEERRIVLLHAVTGMKHREIAALLELGLHLRGQGVEVVVGRGLVVQQVGQRLILHEKAPPCLVCAEVLVLCVRRSFQSRNTYRPRRWDAYKRITFYGTAHFP